MKKHASRSMGWEITDASRTPRPSQTSILHSSFFMLHFSLNPLRYRRSGKPAILAGLCLLAGDVQELVAGSETQEPGARGRGVRPPLGHAAAEAAENAV